MGRGEGPSSLRLGKESNAHCCGLQAGNWQWLMTKLQATPVSFNWNKLKLQLVLISLSRGYGLCVSELWDWTGLDWTGIPHLHHQHQNTNTNTNTNKKLITGMHAACGAASERPFSMEPYGG